MIFPRPFLAAVLLAAAATSAFGQGSLTPSDAPTPTMKTLDQVEPRIPIPGGNAPFTANASGSYYLTGNLIVGVGPAISITADNVTIDLGGFTVAPYDSGSNGTAVSVASSGATSHVVIRHGRIASLTTYTAGSGFSTGGFSVGLYVTASGPVQIEDVTVSGTRSVGIYVVGVAGAAAGPANISHCVVDVAGTAGISAGLATIDHCVALNCNATAIDTGTSGVIDNCNGVCVGTGGHGIQGNVVTNSFGQTAGTGTFAGIYTHNATNCAGASTGSGYGIRCVDTATGCVGTSSTGIGIGAAVANNCHGTSSGTTATAFGIDCGTDGVATGCEASAGNTTAFSIRAKIANGCALGTGSTADITHNVNSF